MKTLIESMEKRSSSLKFISLGILLILSACSNPSKTQLENEFNATVTVSHILSSLAISSSTVSSGGSVTVQLNLKDSNSNPYVSNRPQIVFQAIGGSSTGTIGAITNQGNGSYTASFTGSSVGTATTIHALVDGVKIQSSLPTITVTQGNYSLSNSTLALSATTVSSGQSITATLIIRDNSNNSFPGGGLAILFSNSGGTSTGSWSATIDNNNGTYTATFTGVIAGTATTVSSSIGGSAITSTLPTVTVAGGTATKLAFSTQPSSSASAGIALAVQPVVTVQDSNSNTVTTSSASVQLELFSEITCTTQLLTSPNGANAIFGTATIAASSGVASFSGLAIRKALSTLYFKASSGSLTTDCSSVMNISPGSINSIAFSTQPAPLTNDTDTTFTTQPVVTSYDLYLNVATNNSSASITLAAYSDACSTPVASGITASANPLTLTNGVAIFASAKVVGTNVVRIRASDGTRTACSDALTINPGVPSTLTISSGNSPTQTVARGSSLVSPFVVLLKDANNNVIPSAQINWAVTAGGSLGSGTTVNTDSNGLSSNLLTTGSIGTQTVTATVNGYGLLTQTFTASATSIAFSTSWPFNATSPSSSATYSYDGSKIDFLGGVARLTPSDQVDDDGTSSGFSGGTGSSSVGVASYGTLTGEPASLGLKLGSNGGCNGRSANCSIISLPELYELNSSWTPQWASILGYWKLDGTVGNTVPNSATLSATVGPSFLALNTNGTGLSYVSGQLKQGLNFDGVDDILNTAATIDPDNYNAGFSMGGWVYFSADGTPVAFSQNASWGGVQFWRSGGNLFYRFGSGSSAQSYTTSVAIPLNVWTHIMIVHNTTSDKAYLNGTLAHSSTGATLAGSNSFFQLGRSGINATQFSGYIDEVAVWRAELSGAEVNTIYNRQAVSYSGIYTSRIMDGYASGQSWTSLAWSPTLPFFKALPDYASGAIQNESSTDYSSLSTNSLMTGIVGLWHLNEAFGTNGSGSVTDRSGQGNNGTPTSVTFGESGKISSAALFNGTTSGINLGTPAIFDFGNNTNFSITAWVRTTDNSGQGLRVLANGASTTDVFSGYALALAGSNLNLYLGSTVSAGNILVVRSSVAKINDGKWHLISVSVDWNSSTLTLFVDGVADTINSGGCGTVSNNILNFSSCSGNSASHSGGNSNWIGCSSSSSKVFNGSIDEVAIWSRALGPNEIQQLYQRGASRIKFQARTCSDSTCTSGSPIWKGPSGTADTFFSELFNMSTQAATPSGTVNKAPPLMTLPNYASPVAANQYFQYRAIFESDSPTATLQPELKSVTVNPIHYDTNSPTLIGKNGVNFYSLSSFSQTLGAGCLSGIGYNLGVGATNSTATWYYWNGSAWVTANGTVAQSNTAAVISTNAATFDSVAGAGIVYFKAHLKSSGSTICELDQLDLNGHE